ncbi:hypothetical protein ColLi_13281 [Colletotrichum liriopes]|uniref:DUF6603 domain-containing protein n=1 Tax=Colletotrichum liriopes TaxID=708192 RepID=A0AA37H2M4_9PEZI|nr:hypothetical protein ColLi_13281 [Colletotrichum liriopes]
MEGLTAFFQEAAADAGGRFNPQEGWNGHIYVGGITIGFVPWLFQAAGFCGKVEDPKDVSRLFTTTLAYAILRGPLITLEFATISGITGGFGYNVDIKMPTVTEVPKFPFLNPPSGDNTTLAEIL